MFVYTYKISFFKTTFRLFCCRTKGTKMTSNLKCIIDLKINFKDLYLSPFLSYLEIKFKEGSLSAYRLVLVKKEMKCLKQCLQILCLKLTVV